VRSIYFKKTFLILILLGCLPVVFADELSVNQRIDAAIMSAKGGDVESAISALRSIVDSYPESHRARVDLAVLQSRLGRLDEAEASLQAINMDQVPVYALDAISQNARDAKQFRLAKELTLRWVAKEPHNFRAVNRLVYVLTDSGDRELSIKEAEKLTKKWPNKWQAWVAQGYAYEGAGAYVSAISSYDRAQLLAPKETKPRQRKIFSLSKSGARTLAVKMMQETPELFTPEEASALLANEVASYIRWAPKEPTRVWRDKTSKKAVEHMKEVKGYFQSQEGGFPRHQLNKRFDRLVFLHDRKQMLEVIDGYEALSNEGVQPPPYVMQVVAGAYLYERQPDRALILLQQLRQNRLDNPLLLASEISALIESERYEEAQQLANNWFENEPVWHYLVGSPTPLENDKKLESQYWVLLIHFLTDQLALTQEMLEPLVARAPNQSSFRQLLGSVYSARGWHEFCPWLA